MSAPKSLPNEPFETALARHLQARAEPVPSRLAAAVDEALRETLPARRTGWVGGDALRSRRTMLSFAGIAVAVCLIAAGLAAVGVSRPPARAEIAAPAAVSASLEPTATPTATPAPATDSVAEPGHWAAGGISLRNDGFHLRMLDRDIRDEAPDRVSGEVRQRDGGPLAAELLVEWDADDGAGSVALLITATADDGHWWVHAIQGYRPDDDEAPTIWFESPDPSVSGHGLGRVPLGEPISSDVRLNVSRWSLSGLVDPDEHSSLDTDDYRLRLDAMRFQPFEDAVLEAFAPVGREWSRAELRIESEEPYPVVGQAVLLKAAECVDDHCRLVPGTRWTVDDRSVGTVGKDDERTRLKTTRSGTVTVTARSRVEHEDGPVTLQASRTIRVLPAGPAVTDEDPDSAVSGEYSVFPLATTANARDYVVLTGWACTPNDGFVHGPDRVPGTLDDDCMPADLDEVELMPGAGLRHLATLGPSVAVYVESLGTTVPATTDWNFAGLGLHMGGLDDPVVPQLYTARTRAYQSGIDNERYAHVLTGVQAVLRESGGSSVTRGEEAWRDELDVNGDSTIDGIDLGLLNAILSHQELRARMSEPRPDLDRIPAPAAPPYPAIDVDGSRVITAADRAVSQAQLEASPEPTPLVLDDGTVIDAEVAEAIDSLLSSIEGPAPTATPDPRDRTVEIEAELRATLPEGLDPTGLVQDARGGILFIDRSSGTVHRASPGGRIARIVEPGDPARGGGTIGAAVQLAAVDDYVIIVDEEGQPFRWNSARGGVLARVDLTDRAGFSPTHGDVEIYDPPVGAYRIYVVEPDREQIMKYVQAFDGRDFAAPVPWLASPSEEVANARQLHVDFDMYALLEDGLRRYVAGKWDGSWDPASPPPGPQAADPDYRIVAGSGTDASRGRLYLYDAANARIIGISKVDGRFMRQWVLTDGGPELDDVRGMYVIEGGLNGKRTRRRDDQLVWVTPDGIFRATLQTPALTVD